MGGQAWLVAPDRKATAERPCLWMQAGAVEFRNCTHFCIGIDDFSLRLLAPLERVGAPLIGKRLNRNHPAIGLHRGARHVWALAPVDGVVTEVNPRLREEGVPAGADGYADRWVLRAHAPQLRTDLRDLMIGEQASAFMQTEIERLLRMVEEKTGPLAADGGELGSDIYGHLPQLGWKELAAAFLRASAE